MIKALRTFRVRPSLPGELQPLAELAGNLRWSWHRQTQELFRWADPDTWREADGNPVALLGRLSPARMQALATDSAFLAELTEVRADLQRYVTQPRWAHSQSPVLPRVAYFSPEFGITHIMQVYSGGLGVLAGDHLKAASDLGLDLVGVGLLYRGGYFRQELDADGWQQERYPDLNPNSLPLRRLEADGVGLTVEVELLGRVVSCQIWRAQVGRVPLLLLDTDVATNAPEDRTVTDKLYGGDVEHRLRQEIVLGIGGVRALELASERGELGDGGWRAEVFHSNEGHAGFLQLERIRRMVVEEGLSFDDAVEAARSRVLFTTHTPVPAGIDVFPRELMSRYFDTLAADCGVDLNRLMRLGQTAATPVEGPFNMALLGLRVSAAANGVSRLHGVVSRHMFADAWPGLDAEDTPITSVTNGVHAATWVGREMAGVYDRYLAPDWYHSPDAWGRVGEVGDDALWRARGRARERMVQHLRMLAREQAERRGEPPSSLGWADEILDPDALTVGFARRFAEYKRGNLLLRQPDRLRNLVLSTDRPVQFVFAGKAHPRDDIGKDIIRQLVRFAQGDRDLRARILFVEDYDMNVARVIYAGSDVWLNNPRRPHEACGTSGEKAVLNGGLHCSTLDGWWDEMYDGENGFAIGTAREQGDAGQQDAADGQSLFDLLERTIVPMFYDRAEGRMPRRWLARVRQSLITLGPQVLAARMVREYSLDLYRPIAQRAHGLNAEHHRRAKDLAAWKRRVHEHWGEVAVRAVEGDQAVAELGQRREVEVVVALGALGPADVTVELLYGGVRADGALEMPHTQQLRLADGVDGAGGALVYRGAFDVDLPGEYGVAVRVVPANADLTSWADTGLITWADPEHISATVEVSA